MYEYYVEVYAVREAAAGMNRMAQQGWRVIAVSPDIARGHGIVVTFERQTVPGTPQNIYGDTQWNP